MRRFGGIVGCVAWVVIPFLFGALVILIAYNALQILLNIGKVIAP